MRVSIWLAFFAAAVWFTYNAVWNAREWRDASASLAALFWGVCSAGAFNLVSFWGGRSGGAETSSRAVAFVTAGLAVLSIAYAFYEATEADWLPDRTTFTDRTDQQPARDRQ